MRVQRGTTPNERAHAAAAASTGRGCPAPPTPPTFLEIAASRKPTPRSLAACLVHGRGAGGGRAGRIPPSLYVIAYVARSTGPLAAPRPHRLGAPGSEHLAVQASRTNIGAVITSCRALSDKNRSHVFPYKNTKTRAFSDNFCLGEISEVGLFFLIYIRTMV